MAGLVTSPAERIDNGPASLLCVLVAPPTPAYLVAELRVRDAQALARYARDVQPVMARHGGRILASSVAGAQVVEGRAPDGLLVLHRWRSRADFHAFFASDEYEPLKRLRHEACEARIAIFDAPPAPTLLGALQGLDPEPRVARDVRFLSPAAEYRGRDDVVHLVRTIARVLGDVVATDLSDDGSWRTTAFKAGLAGREADGVLRERCDAAGDIEEAVLFLRPHAALRDGMRLMQSHLDRDPLPSGATSARQ
jgi:uncharacterized protein (DUF1330 family)